MPVSSLNSPVQNSSEIYRLNQANRPPPPSESSEKRQQTGTKDIYTVTISEEAKVLFEKTAEKKTERAEEVLDDRQRQKEASQQVREEQARLADESRKRIDLIT